MGSGAGSKAVRICPLKRSHVLLLPSLTSVFVSGMARDLMVEAAFKCEKNALPIVLTVHDEIIVEVDEDTSAYDDGHITGAIKLDWRTDLQDPVKRDFVPMAQRA